MTSTSTLHDQKEASVERTDADVYVLGGGAVGLAVARRLHDDGRPVTLIDASEEPPGVSAHRGDPTDARALADAGLGSASTVVVATPSDSRNLLIAQLVRVRFGVERVLVIANRPDRVDALSDAGHDPVCASTALADAIVDHL